MKEVSAVFDVNIFVSYFIKNRMQELFDMIFDKNIRLYRNAEMTAELEDVLSRAKFKQYLIYPISHYIYVFETLTVFYPTISAFNHCADPKDNYLFDLAYQANARYLVSGDKKVLEMPVRKSLTLTSLSDFKKEIITIN